MSEVPIETKPDASNMLENVKIVSKVYAGMGLTPANISEFSSLLGYLANGCFTMRLVEEPRWYVVVAECGERAPRFHFTKGW